MDNGGTVADLPEMRGRLLLAPIAAPLAIIWLLASWASAAIVVDPEMTGAANVTLGIYPEFPPYEVLTNPVADPFVTPENNGLLIVGNTGAGAVAISGGSKANVRQIWVGFEAAATGKIKVSGAGSSLTSLFSVNVGINGAGTLEVTGGGTFAAESLYVSSPGRPLPSHVLMSGVGTHVKLDNGLYVSGDAASQVTTTDGAMLEASYVEIGSYNYPAGPSPQATVTNNAKWKTWGLSVGANGRGNLTIGSGSEVTTQSALLGVGEPGATAPLTLANGTLRTDDLYLPAGAFAGNGQVFAKGLVMDGDLRFDATHGLTQTIPIAGQPGIVLHLQQTPGQALGVGYEGAGTLTIADGHQISSFDSVLGDNQSSDGRALVTGAGTKWTVDGQLQVGRLGTGVLTIGAGAIVDVQGQLIIGKLRFEQDNHVVFTGGELQVNVLTAAPDQLRGQGTVRANGIHLDANLVYDGPTSPGSPLVFDDLPGQHVTVALAQPRMSVLGVGYYGEGKLEIRNGAKVESSAGILAQEFNSRGTAIIEGAGSEWAIPNGNLRMGRSPTSTAAGVLKVLSGGAFRNNRIDMYGPSTIEVAGANSRIETQALVMRGGDDGVPSVHIHSGATFNTFEVFTPPDDETLGSILIEGAGSRMDVIGGFDFDNLLVRVRDGAVLRLGEDQPWSQPDINLSQSVLHLDGGTLDAGGGLVSLQNGQLVFENGVLRNFRAVAGNLVQTSGRVEPGNRESSVAGAYFMDEDAHLQLTLSPELDFARLLVSGLAVIEGTLGVSLPEAQQSLPLELGKSFELIRSEIGILGSFDAYQLPELPAGMNWSISQWVRGIELQIIAGDFNQDGAVNAADYTLWRDSDGQISEIGAGADGNRDGYIDVRDLAIWQQFFGRSTIIGSGGASASNITASLANTTVPEPSASALIGFGCLLIAAAFRERNALGVSFDRR